MVFSSALFLFAFLPAFIAIYYVVPVRARNLWIVVASLAFYGWWKAAYLALVLAIAAVTFVAGHFAHAGARGSAARRKWAVRLGVSSILGCLIWFKYSYFLGDIFDRTAGQLLALQGHGGLQLPDIILPIGISFLTFQSISYILDVARGDAPPARNLVDFLAFSLLFPQLIAGPILRYKDLSEQLSHRAHSATRFGRGMRRFVLGLSSKLLIADSVAPIADRMFALQTPTAAEAWLGTLAYSLQLFFDFAGYSAMAIGLGLMIGFRFVENFDAPYTARSITEFWQRWHISLSNWLRDYLYIPLGGNRGGAWLTYRNLVLTMVLGGLWHGANWTFVVWGLWHGGLMALERALGVKNSTSRVPAAVRWGGTMVLVMLGWVVFRAETLTQAGAMYGGMLGQNGWAMSGEMLILLRPSEVIFMMIAMMIVAQGFVRRAPQQSVDSAASAASVGAQGTGQIAQVRSAIGLHSFASLALFALCFVVLQARSHSPFLYFQF